MSRQGSISVGVCLHENISSILLYLRNKDIKLV